jgi:hypothetical protein
MLGCSAVASRQTAALSRPDPDTLALTMRSPDDPYRMGPSRPEWKGRAAVTDTTLMFEFPTIEADNVGCADVDSLPLPAHRRYYWLAAADYPGARYPHNHFQLVALDFALAPEVAPTRVRLDSAFAAQRIPVVEAAGEPPMRIRTVMPERSRAILERTVTAGKNAWCVRVAVEGRDAVRAFLATGADSISLGWCQRDQWLTYLVVPLEGR